MKLSVVVPVYGTAKYLPDCLDSLLRQSLEDCEIILVDDASPDDSAYIIQQYIDWGNTNIRLVRHEQNRGLFASRVTGAKHARGEYIAFLDSDDYVSVDFYRAAIEKADAGSFDIVMGDTVWVQPDGQCIIRPVHADSVMADALYGEEVRRAFYGQELQCYAWHTIWNKVYRKTLWDKCQPHFEQLTDHIIMTEDIAFSSVLMYEAQSFARHRGDGVFYCMHAASSTNSSQANEKKLRKNYGDIVRVFAFVEDFLTKKNAVQELNHLHAARRWYDRMWREASGTQEKADDRELWWFDKHILPWNDGLEKIKRAILGLEGGKPAVVSFDVFDTLIQRPFRQPADLFCLLEDDWQRINRRCLTSFAEARGEAETSARAWARGKKEDVTLADIYMALRLTCGATEDCADMMCFNEREAEVRYVQPRHTGVQLFRLAKAAGLKVVLTSDMYLDKETITRMLIKCGVEGWDAFFLSSEENALKWNGGLYRAALEELDIQPGEMLHIGDNWHNDYVQPDKMGIRAMHHPRAMDVMTDDKRTRLGDLGLQSAASFGSSRSMQAALSFRCMQALTANRFFDNGFAPTGRDMAFGASPALLGYYAVGGHVLSVAQWLIRRCMADGVKKLVFLARDGYLIKRAVEALLPADSSLALDYQPASRRCLLPALTAHPSDFYSLPINIPAYSVGKVVRLLDFCTADRPEDELRAECEAAGFAWDEPFPGKYRFIEFIRWYNGRLYDGCRHQRAYNALREYYEPILGEGAACFDMGYSGRLQSALCQLAGHAVPVYFIHGDDKEATRLSAAYDFDIRCFYPMKPGMSGAFREFLLSSDEPPCLGFTRMKGGVRPIYGQSEYNAAARFLIRCVQENALRFVRDWRDTFAGTCAETVQPFVCSMPFESTLRYLTEADIALFTDVCFEDTVFAGRDDLDLAALIRDQAEEANRDAAGNQWGMVGFIPSRTPLIKRTIGFLLFDRALLKQKAKHRLEKYPKILSCLQGIWQGMKKLLRK